MNYQREIEERSDLYVRLFTVEFKYEQIFVLTSQRILVDNDLRRV